MGSQQESLGNFLVGSQAHIPPLLNTSLSIQKGLLPAGSIKADLLHVAECLTRTSPASVPSSVFLTGLILKCFPLIICEQLAFLITERREDTYYEGIFMSL